MCHRLIRHVYGSHGGGYEEEDTSEKTGDKPVTCFLSGSFLCLFDLKMEAMYSSETSFDFQRTTRRYISEAWALQIEIKFIFKNCGN
jgi:hypothetical protein